MPETLTPTIDTSRTDALANRLVGVANDAALALMLSVGHRTGLFDRMAEFDAPKTIKEIARAAGLSERYVREWLGCMTTAEIVEHDHDAGTYRLPPEHAAVLTRAASPNNIAVTMQWVSVMGHVEDDVVEAFRHGKGVPYDRYHRFHEVMAEESDQTTIGNLIDQILPLVPGLKERLEHGIDVMDLACGRGRAINFLAQQFPNSRFVGVDLLDEPLQTARAQAKEMGLTNARFVQRDAATIDDKEAFDLITGFDAIHDQRDPAAVLANIRRALRPRGVFLMQDIAGHTHHHHNIGRPLGPFTYAISTFHCMSVSLAQGGPGLGAAWGKEQALMMLEDAGFRNTRVHEVDWDMINFYYVTTKA